jgi:hypothetical protein
MEHLQDRVDELEHSGEDKKMNRACKTPGTPLKDRTYESWALKKKRHKLKA